MTVGEMIDRLSQFPMDMPVYVDNGYGAVLIGGVPEEVSTINEYDAMNDPDLEDLIGISIVRLDAE